MQFLEVSLFDFYPENIFYLILGSILQNQGEALVKTENAEHVVLDVTTGKGPLDKLIEESTLVIRYY